jgi:pentose-5-phosphate-3-epimerase/predicted transcriptional regulator
MKISASLYANPARTMADLVRDLDQHRIDYFHIDCRDDAGVFEDIGAIRQLSRTPIDLHLITATPGHFQPLVQQHGVELVTYQYEALASPDLLPRPNGYQQGVAITSGTSIEVFEAVADRCEFVLFMTTIPGESGGQFRRENFQRIRQFMRRYPGVRVHVDGGVNDEVGFILRNMGVSTVVSGSYLVKSPAIGASLLSLRVDAVDSHYYVGDFMLDLADTPTLQAEQADLLSALQAIEDYGHGLVILTDAAGRMAGIITNADIRRGLLRHPHDFQAVGIDEVINRQPICAQVDQTVSELLRHIKQTPFPVNYLPVLDPDRHVVGMVAFYNLVKGEG